MITRRRITPEDTALYKAIRLTALQESPDSFGSTYAGALERTEESWADQVNSSASGPDRVIQLVFHDEECIGLGALYRIPSSDVGELLSMWIAPAFRGTEAGVILGKALLTWAKSVGITSVLLEVLAENHRAIGYYEKLNFTSTGKTVLISEERGLQGIQMVARIP